MIDSGKVLAVIPARGGSKRIPKKNITPVGGKPLLAYTIEAAKKSALIDRLIVSSDDPAIIEVARQYGCEAPFVRPIAIASDEAAGIEPALHALREIPGYEWLVLLQPTSPLRTAADIDGAIRLCAEKRAPACVSVTAASESPFWMFEVDAEGKMKQVVENRYERSQDQPEISILNGAVYVARADWLLKQRSFMGADTIAFKMPRERSLDIDTAQDLLALKALLPTENRP